jgi:hypothetical protein
VDSETGKRFSLKTCDRDAAEQIVLAKNQSLRQRALNLQIATAYLAGTDNGVSTRTWRNAIEDVTETKLGANKEHWQRTVKDPALQSLLPLVIIETKAESLLASMRAGTVSTNMFLRRLQNFCVDNQALQLSMAMRQKPQADCADRGTRCHAADEHLQRRIKDRCETEHEHRHPVPKGTLF